MFGLIGAGLGLLSGLSKDKAAKRANDQATQLQRDQLKSAEKRYEDTQTQYKPIEDKLIALGQKTVMPDYAGVTERAMGDVESQFTGAEAARLRSMQRSGVNPNSGRADALARNLSLTRSLSRVGTINNANRLERDRADNVGWERTYNLSTLGANKMNGATNALTSAQDGQINTQRSQANAYSQQASGLFGAAGEAAGGWLAQDGNQERVKDWGQKASGWLSELGAR